MPVQQPRSPVLTTRSPETNHHRHGGLVLRPPAPAVHWALDLTVEVRQCPLRSGARSWGPAVPTELAVPAGHCPQLRSGSAHWDLEFAVGRNEGKDGRRKYITLIIQYLDPHLIGGEKQEPHTKMRGHKNAASMVFLRFPIFSKVFPCLVKAFLPPWPSRQPRALNALSRTARRLARQSGVLERSAAAAERHIFWETKIGCSQNFTNVHKISPVHVNKRYIRLY